MVAATLMHPRWCRPRGCRHGACPSIPTCVRSLPPVWDPAPRHALPSGSHQPGPRSKGGGVTISAPVTYNQRERNPTWECAPIAQLWKLYETRGDGIRGSRPVDFSCHDTARHGTGGECHHFPQPQPCRTAAATENLQLPCHHHPRQPSATLPAPSQMKWELGAAVWPRMVCVALSSTSAAQCPPSHATSTSVPHRLHTSRAAPARAPLEVAAGGATRRSSTPADGQKELSHEGRVYEAVLAADGYFRHVCSWLCCLLLPAATHCIPPVLVMLSMLGECRGRNRMQAQTWIRPAPGTSSSSELLKDFAKFTLKQFLIV